MSEVERLFKFLLVVPASSATAERSFSTLRRLKNYLRATMAQERLNHVAVLHVYKTRVDDLDVNKLKRLYLQMTIDAAYLDKNCKLTFQFLLDV